MGQDSTTKDLSTGMIDPLVGNLSSFAGTLLEQNRLLVHLVMIVRMGCTRVLELVRQS